TTDYPRLVEIANTWNDEPTTEESERKEIAGLSPESKYYYRTALREGEIVGFGYTVTTPWQKPGEYRTWLRVDPAHRGIGVGRILCEDAVTWAREQNASLLEATVRDNDAYSIGFMERRQFQTHHHMFRSLLDLATFDESPFADVIATKEAEGFRF